MTEPRRQKQKLGAEPDQESDLRLNGSFRPAPVLRPRQQVESQIKQAILDGEFNPGERLPSETRLAEAFGVSRATVREALRALVENGLVVTTPGSMGGSVVQQVDHHALSSLVSDRLGDVLELGSVTYEEVTRFRDMLEVPSARLAALHRTDPQLSSIRVVIDKEQGILVKDPEMQNFNAEFHSLVADASGNRVLGAFVAALHRLAEDPAFAIADADSGRRAIEQHIDIYEAIEAQDPDRAAEAMASHLDSLNGQSRRNSRPVSRTSASRR